MGIPRIVAEYEKEVLGSLGLDYKGLKWCELGNQRHYKNPVAKEIYLALGVDHISIDINGKDGALPIDLDKAVPFIFRNQFDVVTNYGTLEHINNQYQAFKNMDDMCKKGGVMFHTFPRIGHWLGHCRYYYSVDFVNGLGNACNYRIIHCTILDKDNYETPKNQIAVAYIKTQNGTPFITEAEFNEIGGRVDTGYLRRTGDYTNPTYNPDYIAFIDIAKRLPRPIKWLGRRLIRRMSPVVGRASRK